MNKIAEIVHINTMKVYILATVTAVIVNYFFEHVHMLDNTLMYLNFTCPRANHAKNRCLNFISL